MNSALSVTNTNPAKFKQYINEHRNTYITSQSRIEGLSNLIQIQGDYRIILITDQYQHLINWQVEKEKF